MQLNTLLYHDPLHLLPPLLSVSGNSIDLDFLRTLLMTARATRTDIIELTILDPKSRILCADPYDGKKNRNSLSIENR